MKISEKEHMVEPKDLINNFSIVLRTGHFHSIENDAVHETILKLRDIINPYIESEGHLRVDLIGEFFYVNESRIRYPLEFLLNFDYLAEELKKRSIGSVIFSSRVDVKDIKTFLSAFITAAGSATPFETMISLIDNLENITIDKLKKIKVDQELNKRKLVKKTYFNAVSFTKGIMTSIQAGEKISLKKSKRMVESMVDAVLSEEQLLIGMTSIKDYDEYTYHHSVNVSILSIAFGQRIGLNRKNITALGIAALFHDMGKTRMPLEVLNKPSYLSEEEWKIMHRHPFWGALAILTLKGIDELSIKNALASFQHHMHCDHSGYPKLREPLPRTFFTKIISIADQYDAMTTSRVYAKNPLSPDKALGVMLERCGTQLDPILFKFFINMVGNYPVGSLVLLDTREMGLVFEGSHSMADRPRVMIIVDSAGTKIQGTVVDLTERDSSGRFLRSIVKTLDPKEYNISLADYLL